MWTVVSDIYNVFTAPQIRSSLFNWTYVRCYWRYIDNSMCVILQTWRQIQRTSSTLRNVNCGPAHIQWKYRSAYSGFNIQLNISPTLLEIHRQFNVRYTANMMPNAAHILQLTRPELWSRTYKMNLQLHIFRLQYSTDCICAAVGDITTIQCALNCKLCANAAHILQFRYLNCGPGRIQCKYISAYSGFNIQLTYLRRYWRDVYNSESDILQTWCQCQYCV
jgi:hypothetical protein